MDGRPVIIMPPARGQTFDHQTLNSSPLGPSGPYIQIWHKAFLGYCVHKNGTDGRTRKHNALDHHQGEVIKTAVSLKSF